MNEPEDLERFARACPRRREALVRLARWSGFARHWLRADEELLARLCRDDLARARSLADYRGRLRERLSGIEDFEGLQRALRRFRNAEMTRIIWRDLNGLGPLREILRELSDLAESCIDLTLDWLYPRACARHGTPRDAGGAPQRLLVLAMGKLGAWELNLSSDIDLVFIFPEHGHTDGARALANETFFTRLARELARALSARTVDGFAFRVDTRLRPFGESGPLVTSLAAFETYLEGQARTWERYAMIKARVVSGPPREAARLMALIEPFVYRGYVDFGVIASLRRMKRLIEREVGKRGAWADIKLGPGGIREIEFIAQAFQLIHGGRDRRLRVRPVLDVLARLAGLELLPAYVVTGLREAYEFLRRVENRLQAWRDEQTHRLPADEAARQRLAESMGYAEWGGFARALETHRRRVQGYFEQVFDSPQRDEEADPPDEPLRDDAARVARWLLESGADSQWRDELVSWLASGELRALDPRGQRRLDRLMPLLLGAARGQRVGREVLPRLLELVRRVARRGNYLELLIENPLAISQLVRLFAASPWIAEQLTRYPVLLDELLDPRRLYAPLTPEALGAELEALLAHIDPDDLEQSMERLRQFARGNRLRVAAADLAGLLPVATVSDYLSAIADRVLDASLRLALRELRRRHGDPQDIEGDDSGFVVIAYGKLGGHELGYGSDLDLVFVHGARAPAGVTDGPRPVPNEQFYIRLGQRLVHIVTTRTHSGRLYEIDMRLRPNGASGLLAVSLGAFARYQREQAWTWEHQALVRARPVTGDRALTERFQALRREILTRPRDASRLRREVLGMREKMRAALDRSDAREFDLKQGAGGIVDIEFMVQYAVLRWAHAHPDLADETSTLGLLRRLAGHGLLPRDEAGALAAALERLRGLAHRRALAGEPARVADDELRDTRARVSAAWRRLMRSSGSSGPVAG